MPPKGKGLLTGAAQKQEGRALKRAHRQVGLLKGEKGAKRLAKQDLKQARLRAKKDKVTAVTEDENASYPEKAAAWAALQALNLAEDEEDDVDDHFNAWLVGKGRDIDHARTPWKRTPLLHNVGVIEHLKMFTDDRWNFIEELNGVWWDVQQGDASVDVLFNYYRFFVRGNLDPESLDNVDYMKFFREMKEGIPEKLKPDTRFVQQGTIDTLNNWALGRGTARSGFVDLDAAEQSALGDVRDRNDRRLVVAAEHGQPGRRHIGRPEPLGYLELALGRQALATKDQQLVPLEGLDGLVDDVPRLILGKVHALHECSQRSAARLGCQTVRSHCAAPNQPAGSRTVNCGALAISGWTRGRPVR